MAAEKYTPLQIGRARDNAALLLDTIAALWQFASVMQEKHGTEGDDTMTDAEHKQWQEAGGSADHVLGKVNHG